MKAETIEARLDTLQAAVLALAASLPPERADLARRVFATAVSDMEEAVDRRPDADAAASAVVAAVLATLSPVRPG
jgi:hypothetical protein